MKIKQRDIRDVVHTINDLVANYKCSCISTEHCPCPRCKVSIDQASLLRAALCSAAMRHQDRKESKKGKHK